ncbi:MAG TPA: hypothetical protein ENK02_08065 [Planctomycetes bacterium]|nr:hypothetical protein [Planctomycetota bacterium]
MKPFPQHSLSVLALTLGLVSPQLMAQRVQTSPIPSPRLYQANSAQLKAMGLTKAILEDLRVPQALPKTMKIQVVLDGKLRTLSLYAHDMRTKGFRLLVTDAQGTHQVQTPPSITYRGFVSGLPESRVAASLFGGQLTATLLMPGGRLLGIQPLTEVDPKAPKNRHIVYDRKDSIQQNVRCGNTEVLLAGKIQPGGPSILATKVAEIAIDADNDFYRRFGSSVSRVQAQVQAVMNAVDTIYKRDVGITYKITTIIVRTSRVYGSTSNLGTRLSQFRSYWNANHRGVKRDVAHLFTGLGSFSGVIGVAYLSVICSQTVGYGTSKAFSSRVTTNAGLVAHELGHNWSARHCNSAGNDCKIMCSGLGGCGRDITRFGNTSKNQIISYKNTRSCLSNPSAPKLSTISPGQVKAYNGGTVTLTGTGLSSVQSIQVGTKTLTTFFAFSDTKLTFQAPAPTQLGPVSVRVSNSNGPSNALNLNYVVTRPAGMTVSALGFPGVIPISYTFGSEPSGLWILIVSPDNKTVSFQGLPVLLNFLPITAGTLDAVGLGTFSAPVPLSLKGKSIFSQILVLKGGSFSSASNIGKTTFF